MLGTLIVISLLLGFVVWQNSRMHESMRQSLVREQTARMKERLSAFRREQYLITLAYTAKPELAAALANVPPPPEVEEPEEEQTVLEGHWARG